MQELAARLVCGGEAPDIAPKVVVLLAGYNNARYVKRSDPAELMDWTVQVGSQPGRGSSAGLPVCDGRMRARSA